MKKMIHQLKRVKPGVRRTTILVFSAVFSLALLIQGFALARNVSAKFSERPDVAKKAQEQTQAPAPQKASGVYQPEPRQIIHLQPLNVREVAAQEALAPSTGQPGEIKPHVVPMGDQPTQGRTPLSSKGGTPHQPLAPLPSVTGQSPPPTYGFRSNDLGPLGGPIPPDTMGAVGPNHVATTTNQDFVVQDRNGTVLTTMSINSFITTPAPLTIINQTDPKIYYDRFNNRWMFTIVVNTFNQTAATLVFVTQTGDPTGTWNRYAIDTDATATAGGGAWADFPSMGFNTNWIVVTINRFGFGSVSGYVGPSVYVIDKAAAYANTLGSVSVFEASAVTACTVDTDLGCGFTMSPAVTEDNTTTTEYLVEDWFSSAGQLRLSKVTGTPAAPVLTVDTQLPQAPNSWRFNATIIGTTGGYVLQRQQNIYAISGNRITANDSRLGSAPVFRNGTLWATHHVMLGLTPSPAGTAIGTAANPDVRTAVQWWEIDPTIETGIAQPPLQFGRIEDPTADNCHNGSGGQRTVASAIPCPAPQGWFYTFPAISVNQVDDVLIGYTRFSNLTLAKASYSVRLGTDPVNTMRDTQTYREGPGNYNIGAGSPFNIRWGDYSAAMTDPVNDTDFWNTQEFADFQTEIFGPGMFAGTWGTWWAQVKPATTTTTAGNLIISEFRLRGPAGTRDEFVELYNPADTPLTVTTTDGSDGWAIAYSSNGTTITALASIPSGTTIPARGRYLITNDVAAAGIAPYSLRAYPNVQFVTAALLRPSDGDAFYTPDLADNGGLAIFRTGNPANMNAATRMDSAGFAGIAAGLFKEGTGIPNITGAPTGQISFHRSQRSGVPQDTSDNATDFIFTDTVIETLGVQPTLGAPGPENVDSPIHNTTSTMFIGLFDGSVSAATAPNFVFNATPVANGTQGTMTVRRRLYNSTGVPITRVRIRFTDITTAPAAVGVADLRILNSPNLTVEEPATQAVGGGLNTSVTPVTVTFATPMAPGANIPIDFVFGVMQEGCFRFVVTTEALPGGGNAVFGFAGTAGSGVCGPTAAPARVSGAVTTADGQALAGVTVRLAGARSATAITDGAGNYHFDNVDTDEFYTVTPSRLNYRFNPVNHSFSLLANKTDAVFTAIPDAVMVGNEIDSPEYFVRQHYLDFLGREPDESGFNFWSDQIATCGDDAGCRETKRVNVSAAYFLSIEFQRTGGLVDGLYRAGFGRAPKYAEFIPDTSAVSRDVVVGRTNWEGQLAANKRAFIDAFVARSAFRDAYDGLSNAAYVEKLIANTGVAFSAGERDSLVSSLGNGSSRADVLLRIAENDQFVNAKRNAAFVMMEYFGYLRRDPDPSGYQFWLNKLNQFDGNFERAEMVKAFINSDEYRARFAR
ncbi:MAG TPA: DUF4214 domain-containing protein [Pyrinomonadaceae bacterium]|nr:DUF4214 domain-containing protein [Pyrinomonadaceae bacterium]